MTKEADHQQSSIIEFNLAQETNDVKMDMNENVEMAEESKEENV